MAHLSGCHLGKLLNFNLEIRPLRFLTGKAMFLEVKGIVG